MLNARRLGKSEARGLLTSNNMTAKAAMFFLPIWRHLSTVLYMLD